jgi:carbamoyltransferase
MVGWFGDRCEFGLRALGARSVFTNPANPYACDNLSSYLKKRPSYMAYAVVMTEEDSPVSSPFLSRSTVLPAYFGENPVRVQTVSRASSPVVHQLLTAFRDRMSVPALLNTSLNYFDEPIACAPRDAVKTFYASGLDMLVMENFVLRKY